jgi:hypothetical protein
MFAVLLPLAPFLWPLILLALVVWGMAHHYRYEFQLWRSRRRRLRQRARLVRAGITGPYVASRARHTWRW